MADFTEEELAERVEMREDAVVHHNPRNYNELHKTFAWAQSTTRKGTGYWRIWLEGTFLTRRTFNIVSAGLIEDQIEVNHLTPTMLQIEYDDQLVLLLLTKELPQAVHFQLYCTNFGAMPRIKD